MYTTRVPYNVDFMKATDILRNEHDNILQSIALLLELCHRYRNGEPVNKMDLGLLLDFFRMYADLSHHEKEEKLLFPQMIANGFPASDSPISVMLHEHTIGRSLVQKMALNLVDYDESLQARNDFFLNAMEYGLFLQQHIHKENMILFQMADQILPEAAQAEMLKKFQSTNDPTQTEEFIQNKMIPLQQMIRTILLR